MATLYSKGTGGNWSTLGTFNTLANGTGTDTIPTGGAAGDDVIIQEDDVVTLDNTTCVAKSVVCNARTTGTNGGSLVNSTTASSKLVVYNGITTVVGTTQAYAGKCLIDMSSVPQYTCEIYVNGARTTGAGNGFTLNGDTKFVGATKTTWAYIDGVGAGGALAIGDDGSVGKELTATAASGWRQGDRIIFCTTQAYLDTVYSKTAASELSWAAGVLTFACDSTTGLNVGSHVTLSGFTNANSATVPLNIDFEVASVGAGSFTMTLAADPGAITNAEGTATLMPRTDNRTLHATNYTNGSTAVVLDAGLTQTHDGKCLVGNFTRNVKLGPVTPGDVCYYTFGATLASCPTVDYKYVEFIPSVNTSTYPTGVLRNNSGAWREISGCAFYNWSGTLVSLGNPAASSVVRTNNVYYSESVGASFYNNGNNTTVLGSEEDPCIFRCSNGFALPPKSPLVRPKISGVLTGANNSTGGVLVGSTGETLTISGGIWSCFSAAYFTTGQMPDGTVSETRLGCGPTATANYSAATNKYLASNYNSGTITLKGCKETVATRHQAINVPGATVEYFDRDTSPANQEVYKSSSLTVPAMSREATTVTRSTSALKMRWTGTANYVHDRSFSILTKTGVPITLIGYFQKNAGYGASTLPYVEISGLGITPVRITATAASVGAWEKFEFLPGTATEVVQNSGGDANLTVTMVGQSAVDNAECWFSGVPLAPFVTRCRHYGYLFDETSPTRTTNSTISASEATAAAYTGMAVTWGASSSSVTLSADQTFQKLYDYTQAQACLNVGSALPLTGAGVAGSPSLFAAGAVTINTGFKLNGNGSISLGANLLSTEFAGAVAYTYTGGTWSQLTTVPTFSGGTLNIGAAGTYTFTMASAIVSMTPTAPSTYAMGGGTFSGTIDLRNTTAHAITVELPSGTSYTTANNTGGAITVTLPVVTANISITGMPTAAAASTRLQIINRAALAASAWAALTEYSGGDIRRRTTGLGSENTAGLYLRCTTAGTSGAAEPTWNTSVGGTTADGSAVWTTYAVLFYDADPVTASLADTYIDGEEFLAGETVEIRFAEMDAATSFKTYDTQILAAASGFSVAVNEEADTTYATNALNGSSYESTFSPNFAADYIVLDSNADFSGKAAYAYFCYTLTTGAGMYEFWGGVTALDPGNYRINVGMLNLYFDESAGFVKQTDDVRIFRSDGVRPALDPTTGGNGIEINWRTPVSVVSTGGSALTPTESSYLLALPVAATNASAVRTELATELAEVVLTRKLLRNKRIIDRVTGIETLYDDDGSVLYTRAVKVDEAGTIPYDGTAAPHRVERYA